MVFDVVELAGRNTNLVCFVGDSFFMQTYWETDYSKLQA